MLVAVLVRGEQPVQQVVGLRPLDRIVGQQVIVKRAAFLVLALVADVAGTGDFPYEP